MAKPNGLWWVLLGTALVACSRPKPVEPETLPAATIPVEPQAPEREDAPIFVGLELRDHDMWLHMGADGPRYTVQDKGGRVLADQIDEEQLMKQFPELHWSPNDMVDIGYEGEVSGVGY